MTDNSTPEQATGSDNEIRVVEGLGKLNDPTGQYASGKSRVL
jgi:hypothetical protein